MEKKASPLPLQALPFPCLGFCISAEQVPKKSWAQREGAGRGLRGGFVQLLVCAGVQLEAYISVC